MIELKDTRRKKETEKEREIEKAREGEREIIFLHRKLAQILDVWVDVLPDDPGHPQVGGGGGHRAAG